MKNRVKISLSIFFIIIVLFGIIFSIHDYEKNSIKAMRGKIDQFAGIVQGPLIHEDEEALEGHSQALLFSENYYEIIIRNGEDRVIFRDNIDRYSFFDQLLEKVSFIRLIPFSKGIIHDGESVGNVKILWINRNVYYYFFALIVTVMFFLLTWSLVTGAGFSRGGGNGQSEDEEHEFYDSKMEAVEQLAAGFTHGLNNPLMILIGNVKAINKDKEITPKILKRSTKVLESANRIQELVSLIKLFTKQSKVDEWNSMQINQIVGSLAEEMGNLLQESKIKVNLALDEKLPEISGGHIQLRLAFKYILNNCVDALLLGDDGAKEKEITIASQTLNKDKIQVTFHDNGVGMSDIIIPKIFNPFFSTKDSAKGTGGISLSIAKHIFEVHKGEIRVESEQNVGTTFTLKFPIDDSVAS